MLKEICINGRLGTIQATNFVPIKWTWDCLNFVMRMPNGKLKMRQIHPFLIRKMTDFKSIAKSNYL